MNFFLVNKHKFGYNIEWLSFDCCVIAALYGLLYIQCKLQALLQRLILLNEINYRLYYTKTILALCKPSWLENKLIQDGVQIKKTVVADAILI
jgi:hypothetical protein